jgi:hypothetical protein
MSARLRCVLLLVLLASALAGCARAPVPGTPVSPSDLRALASALKAGRIDAESMRGSGTGSAVLSGRRIRFDFALLYSRPRWLRLDLKPSLGAVGSSLTVLAVVDGLCGRAYLPQESVELRTCFADSSSDASSLDAATFLLGCPDSSLLERLENASLVRRRDSVVVRGEFLNRGITVAIDEELGAVNEIHVEDGSGERVVSLSYSGYERVDHLVTPRDIEIVALEGTARESRIELHYSSLKTGGEVVRDEYAYRTPAGVRILSWEELGLEEER